LEKKTEKILVTYATNSGSTADVGKVMTEEIQKTGADVDFMPIAEVQDLTSYTTVVLGAPMIFGWHRQALKFLKKHNKSLLTKQLAVFVTCMNLTDTGEEIIDGIPITVDENLRKPPQNRNRLSLKERYSKPSNYIRPILQASKQKPVSIAFFAGQLNYSGMRWWAMIFVILILKAQAGDRRNWDAIRKWSTGLRTMFDLA
jgi:menaquinone-dependent protoporphyrinogen IX oxidase